MLAVMVLFALLCTLAAFVSGLLAVGSGRDWHFTTSDIFRGKRNAVLYVWVIASTIYSLLKSTMLLHWFLMDGKELVGPDYTTRWMSLHIIAGLLFVGAHIFVRVTLRRSRISSDEYLWGSART